MAAVVLVVAIAFSMLLAPASAYAHGTATYLWHTHIEKFISYSWTRDYGGLAPYYYYVHSWKSCYYYYGGKYHYHQQSWDDKGHIIGYPVSTKNYHYVYCWYYHSVGETIGYYGD